MHWRISGVSCGFLSLMKLPKLSNVDVGLITEIFMIFRYVHRIPARNILNLGLDMTILPENHGIPL